MLLTTSLYKLRKNDACIPRYKHLREALGKNFSDNTRISLLTILNLNGIEDALWALCATYEDITRVARLMAADFAELSLHNWLAWYPDDNRPALAIQASRDFANNLITEAQLSAARSAAAWSAAKSAARSAAAESAAWSAARANFKKIFVSYVSEE